MSDWELDLEQSPHQPHQHQQPQPTLSRLSSKQRRTIQTQHLQQPITNDNGNSSDPITPTPTSQYSYRAQLNTLGGTPRQNRPSSSHQQDDPFAAHTRTPPQHHQQSFIHPLMQEPLRMHSTQDPAMQRISTSLLRESLTRDASTFIPPPISGGGSFPSQQQNKTLPPLQQRPHIPALRLNDVIQQVRGTAATQHLQPLSQEEQANLALKEKVARMKLHQSIAPAAAGQQQPPEQAGGGLDPDRAAYVDSGVTVEYDENDDDAADEYPRDPSLSPPSSHPLTTPRKNLPTSRVPIDPDDLARKPEDLRESQLVSKDELMRFRRNDGPLLNQTSGGGVAVAGTAGVTGTFGNTSNTPLIADAKSKTLAAPVAIAQPIQQQQHKQDTYIESKTTGEFIRVRYDDKHNSTHGHDPSHPSHHTNIHSFDSQIDTILLSVHTIQQRLNMFWLCMLGLLCGGCLLQVYLVYLRKQVKGEITDSDRYFLSYYSILAGPARKVIYVLLGFSTTLSWWRFLLERNDTDRHEQLINRYYIPNRERKVFFRNLVCCVILSLGFIITLVMVPIDDYMENEWLQNPAWYVATSSSPDLPSYFTSRIGGWYIMTMVRLICVLIAWACVVWRFGEAEANWLQLEQEKYEQGQQQQGANANFVPLTARTGATSMDQARLTHRAASMTSTTGGGMEASASASTRR